LGIKKTVLFELVLVAIAGLTPFSRRARRGMLY